MGEWGIEHIHIFIRNVKHSERLFNYTIVLQNNQEQRKSDCGRRKTEK